MNDEMNDRMSARLLPKQASPQLTRPRTKRPYPMANSLMVSEPAHFIQSPLVNFAFFSSFSGSSSQDAPRKHLRSYVGRGRFRKTTTQPLSTVSIKYCRPHSLVLRFLSCEPFLALVQTIPIRIASDSPACHIRSSKYIVKYLLKPAQSSMLPSCPFLRKWRMNHHLFRSLLKTEK